MHKHAQGSRPHDVLPTHAHALVCSQTTHAPCARTDVPRMHAEADVRPLRDRWRVESKFSFQSQHPHLDSRLGDEGPNLRRTLERRALARNARLP
eukprot:6199844-Pleurochrysis_carterae.AAC.1